MAPLVIRVCFKSGKVSEHRGDQEDLKLLFAGDPDGLIDYVIALEQATGDVWLVHHKGDDRWTGYDPRL